MAQAISVSVRFVARRTSRRCFFYEGFHALLFVEAFHLRSNCFGPLRIGIGCLDGLVIDIG